MPALVNGDVGASLETLAEGFDYLKDEYCRLAHSYQGLQAKTTHIEEQCASLRLLLSRNPPSEVVPEETLCTPKPDSIPSKSLLEHLESHKQPNKQHTLERIKEAEFEAVKVRPRCGQMNSTTPGHTPSAEAESFVEKERDFTVPGKTPGKLGCPFSNGLMKPQNNGLPTPRSSTSHLRAYSRQSRRGTTSVNDRTQTRSQRPSLLSSVASAAEGPQCPIRFMDSHSPEEIAEFLKHNSDKLPRSHEVCVRRFQSNAGEMDAKYGDLPRLIEGIGKKHQSFMPKNASQYADDGNEDDVEFDEDQLEEDSKSHKRVESWAKGLQNDPNIILEQKEEEAMQEKAEEVRLPRFDRPLKDVRVGESPSRPWGVPIPAKYLDAARDGDEVESVAAAPEDLGVVSRTKEAGTGGNGPVANEQKSKGKCPFDHTAMVAAQNGESSQPPATQPKSTPKRKNAKPPSDHGEPRLKVYNGGVAVVRRASDLDNYHLQNEGTVIIGYGADLAAKILESLPNTQQR